MEECYECVAKEKCAKKLHKTNMQINRSMYLINIALQVLSINSFCY